MFMLIPQVLTFGCAVVLNTLVGQAYGAKNYQLCGTWLHMSVVLLTILTIPVVVYYFYVESLVAFMTDDPEVIRLAGKFARWCSLSAWPQVVYCAIRQFYQAQEIVMPSTVVSALSVGVNVGFNYLFIYGFGSWEGLGFIGSPLATAAAFVFQVSIVICCICHLLSL